MIGLFTGIWSKISAVLVLLSAVFWFVIKSQSKKIKALEHENKIKDKTLEITKEQTAFKAQVLADEQDSILKMVDENAKKNKFDRLNDL